MGLTVSGLSSGIDYATLIQQLVQVERTPITLLEGKKSNYQQKNAAYTDLASKLESLESAADALRSASDWGDRTTTISDTDELTASASSSAQTGTYTITVTELALSHKFISGNGVADDDSAVASGSGSFTFKIGTSGTEYSVSVDAATTLTQLKDSLNALDQGLNAIIVDEGSGATPYRLILTTEDTGADNIIIVTQDDTNLGFAVNDTTLTSEYHLQEPQDAAIDMDGLDVTRSSNTVTDLVPGTTLYLHKDSGTAVTLQVNEDREGLSEKVQTLIDAYNDVISYINARNNYNTETHDGGPLHAEGTVRSITRSLGTIISTAVTGLPETMKVLAQIGVETNTDGTLELDIGTLNDELDEDLEAVTNLFIDDGTNEGIADQLYDYVADITKSGDGLIAARQKGLSNRVDFWTDKIADMEAALVRYEERLTKQFTALEQTLSNLQSQDMSLFSTYQ